MRSLILYWAKNPDIAGLGIIADALEDIGDEMSVWIRGLSIVQSELSGWWAVKDRGRTIFLRNGGFYAPNRQICIDALVVLVKLGLEDYLKEKAI